jgi:hypothetical protein
MSKSTAKKPIKPAKATPSKKQSRGCIFGFALGFVLVIVIVFVGIITCSGRANGGEYTINVTGASGLAFTGSYLVIDDNKAVTQSVEGTVPMIYTISGELVSCTFQKKTDDGTLKVRILKGDRVVKESETSSAYGAVDITAD